MFKNGVKALVTKRTVSVGRLEIRRRDARHRVARDSHPYRVKNWYGVTGFDRKDKVCSRTWNLESGLGLFQSLEILGAERRKEYGR